VSYGVNAGAVKGLQLVCLKSIADLLNPSFTK
jgi:hypothetical protein